MKDYQSIDEYIATVPKDHQAQLRLVRDTLRETLPTAEERISWKMPTYWRGKNIIHFAAAKKHIGIYPGPEAVSFFKDSIPYDTDKGTIRIPYENVDIAIIKKIALWCDESVKRAQSKLK